jgi:hypothetical protein
MPHVYLIITSIISPSTMNNLLTFSQLEYSSLTPSQLLTSPILICLTLDTVRDVYKVSCFIQYECRIPLAFLPLSPSVN